MRKENQSNIMYNKNRSSNIMYDKDRSCVKNTALNIFNVYLIARITYKTIFP